jgi:rhodanese-related sulfurtransferase
MNPLSTLALALAVFLATATAPLCKDHHQNKKQAIGYFEKELEFTTNPYGVKNVVDGKQENTIIIDVRSAESFAKGHIPGAINIPHEKHNNFEGEDKIEGLRKGHMHYVYCYKLLCNLGQKAALKFARHGYAVKEMKGGFEEWEKSSYPVEK